MFLGYTVSPYAFRFVLRVAWAFTSCFYVLPPTRFNSRGSQVSRIRASPYPQTATPTPSANLQQLILDGLAPRYRKIARDLRWDHGTSLLSNPRATVRAPLPSAGLSSVQVRILPDSLPLHHIVSEVSFKHSVHLHVPSSDVYAESWKQVYVHCAGKIHNRYRNLLK